jgi:Flp pilus assembly protein TadG
MIKHKRRENGQSMLEFILVMPIFFFMIFLIIDFGWLFYNYVSVENAARSAAREACVGYQYVAFDKALDGTVSPCGSKDYSIDAEAYAGYQPEEKNIVDKVKQAMKGSTSPATIENIKVTYSADTDPGIDEHTFINRQKGDVTVQVTCKTPVFTPVFGAWTNSRKITIKSSATYKVERNANVKNDVTISDD